MGKIYGATPVNPDFSELFNNAMDCDARLTVQATIEGCPEVFDRVESLVDVGDGNGTALILLVKTFPWIRGINFDLPHVFTFVPKSDSIENVGGDMFMSIPNADAAFLMVIIVEAVLEEDKEGNELGVVGLMLDITRMAITNKGKERTLKEWSYVLRQFGFTRFTVKPIRVEIRHRSLSLENKILWLFTVVHPLP
ncbi:hypothetical protein PVK06_013090 [Gossypium arboreum]|uniref:O-methyltransferase C-terminal domain-containing protein n=1 Tax=Gossypium arboreum TaxID=29729 RepID=A0ABR0QD72_GOSAR|nr:hypothetical protein PVK06_013090 [Gossypium arboreum]